MVYLILSVIFYLKLIPMPTAPGSVWTLTLAEIVFSSAFLIMIVS
ncbi:MULTISPECIES: hypothetical protein [Blautia]|nr:hypothetical protein [Blautia glucerasea]